MNKETLEYKFYKFSLLTFLMMLSAINYNVFINPSKIVAGGVNGISIIVENIFKITPTITIFVVSISILIFGLVLCEYELVVSALYTSIIYPVFVGITSSLDGIISFSNSDLIVISIFSGIISGVISGITCKLNTSRGGIILIAQLLNKKFKFSLTKLNTIFCFVIIVGGGFVFGMESILYAIISLVASKIVMEKVMLGISREKLFQIITTKHNKMIEYIEKTFNNKYTIFEVDGSNDESNKNIIMVLIPTIDYFMLKEGIMKIDSNAFMLITDAYESKISK